MARYRRGFGSRKRGGRTRKQKSIIIPRGGIRL